MSDTPTVETKPGELTDELMRVAANHCLRMNVGALSYEMIYEMGVRDLNAALAPIREALATCLKVVDDCYEVTGHIRVAKTSDERLKILAAMKMMEVGK